ncbi:hypothetical protein V6Z11_A11G331100 [Gossypium hirsutum]
MWYRKSRLRKDKTKSTGVSSKTTVKLRLDY